MPVDDQTQKPRKPKTEAQKARERERRKRRRQNKQRKLALSAGSDVPKILGSEGGEAAALTPAPDLERVEESVSSEFAESAELAGEIPPEPAEEILPELAGEMPPAPENPPEPDQTLMPSASMDESQRVFERGVADLQEQQSLDESTDGESRDWSGGETGSVPTPQMQQDLSAVSEAKAEAAVEEEKEPTAVEAEVGDVGDVGDEADEEELNRRKREEAEKISSSLLSEDEMLVEVPQKQGLLGRLFDSLEKISEKRRAQKMASADLLENVEGQAMADSTALNVEEAQLSPRSSLLGSLLKWVLRLIILAALVVAAFWAGSSLKVFDFFNQLWKPLPPGLELYVSGDGQVLTDRQMLQKLGFETARLAGANLGNAADLTYNVFFNANYFGRLLDPVSVTETGISAAIYYGFGRDNEYMRNRFIFYVKFLSQLRNSNKVKIADVLDGKVRRDLALDGFIAEMEALFDEGNTYRKEIALQVDDLKIAVNSINPEKDRYENDFFVALDSTSAEKADLLIQSFVEITRKQVELKAKLAALTQLYQYYENALVEMKTRLEAVKKNREALIGGVEVVETPGVDLGLIRQQ